MNAVIGAAFGINWDPSITVRQHIDPVQFIRDYPGPGPARSTARTPSSDPGVVGRAVLGFHLTSGEPRRE